MLQPQESWGQEVEKYTRPSTEQTGSLALHSFTKAIVFLKGVSRGSAKKFQFSKAQGRRPSSVHVGPGVDHQGNITVESKQKSRAI